MQGEQDSSVSEKQARIPSVDRSVAWPTRKSWPWQAWPLLPVLLGSLASWSLLFALFPPHSQNFPLGDDWAFMRSAIVFAQGEGFHYFDFASMPQIGQWLWALPFLWLGGSTAPWLFRLSTIVASWLGIIAFYDLLRQDGIDPRRAAFVAAAFAFSPLIFLSTGTFMTDVPTLAAALIALALYARGVRSARRWLWALAALLATGGALTRQNAIAVPLTAAFLLWRKPALRRSPLWVAGSLVPLLAAIATHAWFQSRSDIIAPQFALQPPHKLLMLPFLVLHTLGLVVLPILILNPPLRSRKAVAFACLLMFAAALTLGLFPDAIPSFDTGPLWPYLVPMLGPWGPFAGHFMVGDGVVLLAGNLRLLGTVLGCIAGAVFLVLLARKLPRRRQPSPLILFSLLQVLMLFIAPYLYDRYLEFFLPGALAVAAHGPPSDLRRKLAATAALALMAVLSICLMHDWLAWNSARWTLGQRALARGISARDVEGGFEWDGWFAPRHKYPPEYSRSFAGADRLSRLTLPYSHFHFWWVTGKYALAFTPLPQSEVIDTQPYGLWLDRAPRRFYLLRSTSNP